MSARPSFSRPTWRRGRPMLRSRLLAAAAIGGLLAVGLFPPLAAASSTHFLPFPNGANKVAFDTGEVAPMS